MTGHENDDLAKIIDIWEAVFVTRGKGFLEDFTYVKTTLIE